MDVHTTYRDALPRRMQGFHFLYLDSFISNLDPDREGFLRVNKEGIHRTSKRFQPRTQAYEDSEKYCLVQAAYFDGHLATDNALLNLPNLGKHTFTR
jgi:hypothetical protein